MLLRESVATMATGIKKGSYDEFDHPGLCIKNNLISVDVGF